MITSHGEVQQGQIVSAGRSSRRRFWLGFTAGLAMALTMTLALLAPLEPVSPLPAQSVAHPLQGKASLRHPVQILAGHTAQWSH